ncbi:MAG: hypothetical protein ACR2QF_14435 [Geminicoccaceae bacterium]
MKKSEIADLLVDDGECGSPELVKVDIQVRSGGGIVPPPWAKSMRKLRDAEPKADIRRPRREGGGG